MISLVILAAMDADTAAYEAGRYMGIFLMFVIILASIWKCITLMRRPHTSTLCVLSLLLLFVSWMINNGWNLVLVSGWVPASLSWLVILVSGPLLLGVLIVAIFGLALYDSNKFIQGRSQAIWAILLGLSGLAIMAMVHLAEPLNSLALKLSEQARVGSAGAASVKEDLNYSLTPPDSTWIPQSPASYSSAATSVFMKRIPETYAMVIGEKSQVLLEDAFDTLVETVKNNLSSKVEVRKQTEERVKINGVEFSHITSIVWNNSIKMELAYEHWVATRNGFAWQVLIWGSSSQATTIADSSAAMIKGFRILDMDRSSLVVDTSLDVNRPSHGYSTNLANLGWQAWNLGENKENALPVLTDFGVQTAVSAIIVLPYHHEIEGPMPDMEALARAGMATFDFTYNRNSSDYTTRTLQEPFPGLEVTTEREVEGGDRFRYLFRFYQSGRHAWMVGGWTQKLKNSSLDKVRTSLERIHFSEPSGEVPKATDTSERAKATALFVNQIGLWYHDHGKQSDALRYFREASKLQPSNRTYFENITQALESDNRYDEALTFMDTAKDQSFSKDHGFQSRRAWLLLKAGKSKEGAELLISIIKEGYKNHDNILDCLNVLVEAKKYDESKELINTYATENPEARPRLWQAQVADRSEDPKRAIELLEALIKDDPNYLEARYVLGELFNRQGEFDQALEVADWLEKEKQETVRLYLMRGWSHMGRKWYKDAKKSFELAAKLAPEDEEVKSALLEASASLGQGSNTEIKTPIEPVPLPQRISSRLDELRALPENYGEGHSAAMLLRCQSINYTAEKPMRTTTRRMIRILNDEGADAYSSMEFGYDPLIERLYVNHAQVTDASGQVVASAGVDDIYVLDSEDRSMATTERTVHIQVPGLKTGHTLDCEITVERLSPRKTFPLLRHLFAASIPTRVEAMSVTGDLAAFSEDLYLGENIKVTREGDSVLYEVADAPLITNEPYQQSTDTWAPVLVLSHKGGSWEEVGRDYLKEIADRMKPDLSIEAEAKRLTEGLKGARAISRALASFVQKSVRYKAIEFGVRGQMPNPPAQTLQQRYGDCKDQALLLHHLLRACGVTSHLALVNTQWEIDLKQPTLDAFNHAIVHVPDLKDTLFIDTTSSYLSVADQTPYGLWGQSAFVIDPDKPRLIKIPGPTSNSGVVSSKRHLSLLPPDGIRVVEELTLDGYYASGMRSSFSRQEPKARFQYAQDILDDIGSYRLEDFEFENLADVTLPAVMRLTYTLPNAIEKRGEVTKLKLPSAWETDYLRISFIKDRLSPFAWNTPFNLHSEVTWDDSLKIQPESLSQMVRQEESRFGRWEMKAKDSLHFDFYIHPGRHPAGEYADFQSLWSSAHDLWLKELTINK